VEPILDSARQKLCDFRSVVSDMEKFFVTTDLLPENWTREG